MAKIAFTGDRVTGFKCPPEKAQAFIWDSGSLGLGLRATPKGKPSYVFQSTFQGKDIRMTIGSPDAWSIPQAREKARELQRQIDEGRDPRNVKAEITAADVAKREAEMRHGLMARDVWDEYLKERRPFWGDRHYEDHIKHGSPEGLEGVRVKELKAGVLAELLALPLRDLTASAIESWATKETKTRATSARLGWRLLKAFLNWCAEHPEYAELIPARNPAKSTKAREALGKPGVKTDALERSQLEPWFDTVKKMQSATVSAYLQIILLTGARPGEVLAMKWKDINVKWKGITIRDKDEGDRTIPLTPYVAHLLGGLRRRNEWVFAGPRVDVITSSNILHNEVCKVAGFDPVSLHGLRRSFKSLTEWMEVPVGVVAQIMGHKPSATAEKHYTVRPLELLAIHHERIEAWILQQAKVPFDPKAEPAKLHVVK